MGGLGEGVVAHGKKLADACRCRRTKVCLMYIIVCFGFGYLSYAIALSITPWAMPASSLYHFYSCV